MPALPTPPRGARGSRRARSASTSRSSPRRSTCARSRRRSAGARRAPEPTRGLVLPAFPRRRVRQGVRHRDVHPRPSTRPAHRCRRTTSSPGCADREFTRGLRPRRRRLGAVRHEQRVDAGGAVEQGPRVLGERAELEGLADREHPPLGGLEAAFPRFDLDTRPVVRVVLEAPRYRRARRAGRRASRSCTSTRRRAHALPPTPRGRGSLGRLRALRPPPGIPQRFELSSTSSTWPSFVTHTPRVRTQSSGSTSSTYVAMNRQLKNGYAQNSSHASRPASSGGSAGRGSTGAIGCRRLVERRTRAASSQSRWCSWIVAWASSIDVQ